MDNGESKEINTVTDVCLLACKHALTPNNSHEKLSSIGNVPFKYVQAYKRLIGRLLYLTNIRPDITFFVQQLSQFLVKPTIAHYTATIRILIYIKGSPSIGLFFSSNTYAHLKAFCDSDWGHIQ